MNCHCGLAAEDCGNGMEDICELCLIAWRACGEPEACPCGGRWYAFTGRPANTYNAPAETTLPFVLARRGFANVAVGSDVVPVRYLGLATLSRDLTEEETRRYHIYPVLALTSEPQPRI